MKLRTLSSKKFPLFIKDVTRFAPLWGLYLIGGLLVLLSGIGSSDSGIAAIVLADNIGTFAMINLIYAALCAQLLFGDLFNARLCNALHALPQSRETWFLTHIASGLCFSLVPHLISALIMAPMLGELWYIAFIWLLGMTLEFLFFYGLAVFSVFCTGNRFAMASVYAILNFAAMILYWFLTTLYQPLLYGICFPAEFFYPFSPVVQMLRHYEYTYIEFVSLIGGGSWVYWGLGEGWGYLAICAGIGVALMGAALLMYRRRKLECAGDFIAVKPLAPIFSVAFTLCAGCLFALFAEAFNGSFVVFLIVGMIVGYFAGQMLLHRKVNVINTKAFGKLGLILLVMLLSLGICSWDPMGFAAQIPEVGDVQKVELCFNNHFTKHASAYICVESDEDIKTVLYAHERILDYSRKDGGRFITLRYTLNDGRQLNRTYNISEGSSAYFKIRSLYADSSRILGYSDWQSFCDSVITLRIDGSPIPIEQRQELLDVLKLDIDAGNVLPPPLYTGEGVYLCAVEIELPGMTHRLFIWSVSGPTIAWLKEHCAGMDFWELSHYEEP